MKKRDISNLLKRECETIHYFFNFILLIFHLILNVLNTVLSDTIIINKNQSTLLTTMAIKKHKHRIQTIHNRTQSKKNIQRNKPTK